VGERRRGTRRVESWRFSPQLVYIVFAANQRAIDWGCRGNDAAL
jgi:hypothetical protein